MPRQGKPAILARGHESAAKREASSATEAEALYRIEQVADLTGLTKRTLRYYEERGLLDPPTRTDGNYRLYTVADVEHIKRVKRIRELLGASLAEIKEMVEGEEARQSFRDAWAQTTDPVARLTLLDRGQAVVERQLKVVRARMNELRELEDALTFKQNRYIERREQVSEQLMHPASTDSSEVSSK